MDPVVFVEHHVAQRAVGAAEGERYYALPVGDQRIGCYARLGETGSTYRADLRMVTNHITQFDLAYRGTGVPAHRPLSLVRQERGAAIHAYLPLDGAVRIEYRGADYLLEPGRFTLLLTTEPLRATHSPRCRMLGIAMTANPSCGPEVTGRLGSALPVSGVSELLARHVQSTMRVAHALDSAGLAAAASAAAELFAATIDRTSATRWQPPPAALVSQLELYIESRLGDPHLGVEQLAAAHHISVRTLYRVFRRRGETVHGYLRARRLDRCHSDLINRPDLKVAAVCARWGIADVSHFARQYRERFGCTPMETRAGHRPAED